MPRKRRDEEVVISIYKRLAQDRNCPYVLQVYCVNQLALLTKMFTTTELNPIPGTTKKIAPDSVTNPPLDTSKSAPTDVEVAAAETANGIKDFMKELTGGG